MTTIIKTASISDDEASLGMKFPNKRKSLVGKVKKSLFGLKRSQSGSSCDSTFSSHYDNDNDMESICSTITDYSFHPRSCLKKDEVNDISNGKNKKKSTRKQKLRFSSNIDVVEIKSLFEYASELWYSDTEIKRCRIVQADFSEAPAEVKEGVRAYIQAYLQAREEVFGKPSCEESSSEIRLSLDLYYQLALGYARGYNGLETYDSSATQRRKGIKERVSNISEAYYTMVVLKKKNSSDAEEKFRAYARSLTDADRYWASAMGNASAVVASSIHSPEKAA